MFLGTAAVFALTPGPGILYVLARSLGGRGDGVRSALGHGLGAPVHVIAAALGLSALLATSAVAFTVGQAGGRRLPAGPRAAGELPPARGGSGRRAGGGWESTRAHGPARAVAAGAERADRAAQAKTAVYFMALYFMALHPGPVPAPLVFLLLGFVALGMAMLAVALFAGRLAVRIRGNARSRVRRRVASGAVMIAARRVRRAGGPTAPPQPADARR